MNEDIYTQTLAGIADAKTSQEERLMFLQWLGVDDQLKLYRTLKDQFRKRLFLPEEGVDTPLWNEKSKSTKKGDAPSSSTNSSSNLSADVADSATAGVDVVPAKADPKDKGKNEQPDKQDETAPDSSTTAKAADAATGEDQEKKTADDGSENKDDKDLFWVPFGMFPALSFPIERERLDEIAEYQKRKKEFEITDDLIRSVTMSPKYWDLVAAISKDDELKEKLKKARSVRELRLLEIEWELNELERRKVPKVLVAEVREHLNEQNQAQGLDELRLLRRVLRDKVLSESLISGAYVSIKEVQNAWAKRRFLFDSEMKASINDEDWDKKSRGDWLLELETAVALWQKWYRTLSQNPLPVRPIEPSKPRPTVPVGGGQLRVTTSAQAQYEQRMAQYGQDLAEYEKAVKEQKKGRPTPRAFDAQFDLILSLFFRYLPYALVGAELQLNNSLGPEERYSRARRSMGNRSLAEKAGLVIAIRTLIDGEYTNASNAWVEKQNARTQIWNELIALKRIDKERKAPEVGDMAEAYDRTRDIQARPPVKSYRLSGQLSLFEFYNRYFAEADVISADSQTPVQRWRAFYHEQRDRGRKASFKKHSGVELVWYPVGQKTYQAEAWSRWVKALGVEKGVQAAFEKFKKRDRNRDDKVALWTRFSSLEEFLGSADFKSLEKLLALFDENSKVTPNNRTYAMFVAILNWKKSRGQARNLEGGPEKKTFFENLKSRSSAAANGQPFDHGYHESGENWAPRAVPLHDHELGGLLDVALGVLNLDLKRLDGWDKVVTESSPMTVHQAIADAKLTGFAGFGDRRIGLTSVPTDWTKNNDLGWGFETRFFPVLPEQRSQFVPSLSMEKYLEVLDRPGLYLQHYRVNDRDRKKRPYYKQHTSVLGRMVGAADIDENYTKLKRKFNDHQHDLRTYDFNENYEFKSHHKKDLLRLAKDVGLDNFGSTKIEQALRAREMYVDFLNRVSEIQRKYPYEGPFQEGVPLDQRLPRALSQGTQWTLSQANNWAGWVTQGWWISKEGGDQLQELLDRYKQVIDTGGTSDSGNYSGKLVPVKGGARHHWMGRALYQAGELTRWSLEKDLNEKEKEKLRLFLILADHYFAMELQHIEYEGAVVEVAKNVTDKLQTLCSSSWVKNTKLEDMRKEIKASGMVYYENLLNILNESLPEGEANDTFEKLLEIKHDKHWFRDMMDGVGIAFNVLIPVMIMGSVTRFSPFGGRVGASFLGRYLAMGFQAAFGSWFAYLLYDEFDGDYWRGEREYAEAASIRDTVLDGGDAPLVGAAEAFRVDNAERDLMARQKSSLRWAMRLWFAAIIGQVASMGAKGLMGGARWLMQGVAPQTYMRIRAARLARMQGLSGDLAKVGTAEEVANLVRSGHVRELEKLLNVPGANADAFRLSPRMARFLAKDVEAKIRETAWQLKLDPVTLKPLDMPMKRWFIGEPIRNARTASEPLLRQLKALRAKIATTRRVEIADLQLLFRSGESAILKGMGHPVHRHTGILFQFSGFPARLYGWLNPRLHGYGALYRSVGNTVDLSNALGFGLVTSARDSMHRFLNAATRDLKTEIRQARTERWNKLQEEKGFLRERLDTGVIKQEKFDAEIKLLESTYGVRRSDREEVLNALLSQDHPLRKKLFEIKTNQSGLKREYQTEEAIRAFNRFVEVADATGVGTEPRMLRAIAERDYAWLAREFSRPDRILIGSDPDDTRLSKREGGDEGGDPAPTGNRPRGPEGRTLNKPASQTPDEFRAVVESRLTAAKKNGDAVDAVGSEFFMRSVLEGVPESHRPLVEFLVQFSSRDISRTLGELRSSARVLLSTQDEQAFYIARRFRFDSEKAMARSQLEGVEQKTAKQVFEELLSRHPKWAEAIKSYRPLRDVWEPNLDELAAAAGIPGNKWTVADVDYVLAQQKTHLSEEYWNHAREMLARFASNSEAGVLKEFPLPMARFVGMSDPIAKDPREIALLRLLSSQEKLPEFMRGIPKQEWIRVENVFGNKELSVAMAEEVFGLKVANASVDDIVYMANRWGYNLTSKSFEREFGRVRELRDLLLRAKNVSIESVKPGPFGKVEAPQPRTGGNRQTSASGGEPQSAETLLRQDFVRNRIESNAGMPRTSELQKAASTNPRDLRSQVVEEQFGLDRKAPFFATKKAATETTLATLTRVQEARKAGVISDASRGTLFDVIYGNSITHGELVLHYMNVMQQRMVLRAYVIQVLGDDLSEDEKFRLYDSKHLYNTALSLFSELPQNEEAWVARDKRRNLLVKEALMSQILALEEMELGDDLIKALGRDEDKKLSGLGFEGRLFAARHYIPLEVLIQKSVLEEDKLLSFLLRSDKGASFDRKTARILQLLFGDKEETAELKNLLSEDEALRMHLELGVRVTFMERLKDDNLEAFDIPGQSREQRREYLVVLYRQGVHRLEAAGFDAPQLDDDEQGSSLILPSESDRDEGDDDSSGKLLLDTDGE